MMDDVADLTTINADILGAPVRTALGRPAARIIDWQRDTLAGSGDPKTGGVYRITGHVADQGETRSWSLILKVIRSGGGDTDPTCANYWKREVLAYQSGLLTVLPGRVTAPRCFGITEYDGGAWLWLEEITDPDSTPWPLSRYGAAAYRLGQFNGACAQETSLLTAPWLSRNWLHGNWLAQFSASLATSLSQVLEHPLVRQVCPRPSATRLLNLLAERTLFSAAVDRLPQIFCHHDAWRRNMVLRPDPAGHEQAVLIDWADAGSGALGQELAAFVWAPVLYFDLEVGTLHDVEDLAWSRYLDGLRDVGWHGDPAAVRLGYTADVALRSLSTAWLCASIFPDERTHSSLETYFGHPLKVTVEIHAALLPFLLDRADEARSLLHLV